MKFTIRLSFELCVGLMGLIWAVRPGLAWGAACCARSAAAPFLILSDDEAQLNVGVSGVDAVAQASDEQVYFRNPATTDFTSQLRMDAATLVTDRWQVGASVAWVGRSVGLSSNPDFRFGLGDVRLSLGYEVLPNWSYSVWRPQGFLFSVVSFPTGRSKYEKQDTAAEVTGLGFYSVGFGGIFLKRWNSLDAFVLGEFHYSLPRRIENGLASETVVPGVGASAGLGLGWSPGGGALRVGLRLQPRIDQMPKGQAFSGIQESARWISNCDTGLDLSYMVGNTETIMLSYTDQTLLGYAINTNLNRVLALNFQHRWER